MYRGLLRPPQRPPWLLTLLSVKSWTTSTVAKGRLWRNHRIKFCGANGPWSVNDWMTRFSCRPSYRVMLPVAVYPRRKVSLCVGGHMFRGGTNGREFQLSPVDFLDPIKCRVENKMEKNRDGFWMAWRLELCMLSSAATATNRIDSWHLGLPSKASPGEAAWGACFACLSPRVLSAGWHDLRKVSGIVH